MAEAAENEPDKNRFKRMEAAWRALAEEQDWLDGDPPSPGNAMGAKTRPKMAKCKKSKTSPAPAHAASKASVATQNLINMVAVSTTSGAVLLALLAARHF
jgi:hypothetical protein